MKYLHLCSIFLVLGCLVVDIQSMPIENIILPAFIAAGAPAATETPEESVAAAVPLSLLDVEATNPSSVNPSEESQRTARGLGFGGLGGLGGKFGGLGLGFKNFGGLGGFGGLHGFGGGFGGFKPSFGKHFG